MDSKYEEYNHNIFDQNILIDMPKQCLQSRDCYFAVYAQGNDSLIDVPQLTLLKKIEHDMINLDILNNDDKYDVLIQGGLVGSYYSDLQIQSPMYFVKKSVDSTINFRYEHCH